MPDTPPCPEAIQAMFARHGLRCTRQRVTLYQALASTTSHPTADDLHRLFADEGESVSLATVYNTLETLTQAGLAQKLPGKGGPARFDAAIDDHIHLRDEATGEVRDVPHHLSQSLLKHLPAEVIQRIEAELGVTVSQVQIELVARSNRDFGQAAS